MVQNLAKGVATALADADPRRRPTLFDMIEDA